MLHFGACCDIFLGKLVYKILAITQARLAVTTTNMKMTLLGGSRRCNWLCLLWPVRSQHLQGQAESPERLIVSRLAIVVLMTQPVSTDTKMECDLHSDL